MPRLQVVRVSATSDVAGGTGPVAVIRSRRIGPGGFVRSGLVARVLTSTASGRS